MRGLPYLGLLAFSACTQADEDPLAAVGVIQEPCGAHAAMIPGKPKRWREHPPACALPTAETVKRACEGYSLVTSPRYRPPPDPWEDQAGFEPQDPPRHDIADAQCQFANRDRSEAECTVMLSREQEGESFVPATVQLYHRFHAQHGPASHTYSTMWHVRTLCTPDSERAS